jgi:hypothetical protein
MYPDRAVRGSTGPGSVRPASGRSRAMCWARSSRAGQRRETGCPAV